MSAPQDSQNQPADLSSLQSLNFGPSWATSSEPRQPKPPRSYSGERGEGARPGHSDRRPARRDFGGGQRFGQRSDQGGFRPRPEGEGRRPGREDRRRDFREERGPRPAGRDHGPGGGRRAPRPAPVADIVFYPEEKPFSVLSKAIKASMRTYELFEIAHLILEKNDRFVVVCRPLNAETDKEARLWQSVPDHLPFLSEGDAVAHVLKQHLSLFFDEEAVTVEPPKGNFQMVSKCGFTGELIAPPNYHGYQHALRAHHAARLSRLPFEKFLSRIESVRDEAQIKQWLERMTQVTRYTLKEPKEGEPSQFDSFDAARSFLLAHRKEQIARVCTHIRFSGKLIENMPNGPLRATIEGELFFQRQFPLNTANAIRSRLRKLGFCLYKKGAKGIAYVSAVRRKFRTNSTVFADSIQKVFDFVEKHPHVKVAELPAKYLGIVPVDTAPVPENSPVSGTPEASVASATPEEPPALQPDVVPEPVATPVDTAPVPAGEIAPAPDAAESPAPAEGTAAPATAGNDATGDAPVAADSGTAPAGEAKPTVDLSNPAIHELMNTVRWLVSEGYVSEYSDGRLFAIPVMTEAQARAATAADEGRGSPEATGEEMVAELLPEESLPSFSGAEVDEPAVDDAEK